MTNKNELEKERKSQILDAAERVFAEHGFDKARMDDIVDESGLSKGALYWYYKSKDAIIRAMLDRVFISEMREANDLVAMDASASDRLRMFVQFAVREYKHFEKLLPLAYEFIALAYRNKTVRETVVGYFTHYAEIVAEVIQQGIDSGEFKPCEPQSVALALIGMYEGMALVWFLDPEKVDWDQMGDQPLEIFLDGLRVEAD
ncbi:MAG: TetR/AcrR family transcriptional regulator [Anaerolineales bacterium]|jgi:AcrR family transcriptional regulator